MNFNISGKQSQPFSSWHRYTPLIIVLVTFLCISNINLRKGYKDGSMEADGKGYYAYLPAIFIYHDLSFGFFDTIENKVYENPNLKYNYLRTYNGDTINKYFSGTAVCMLPFFLLGHLTTLLACTIADGYSYYYMLWIHIGALFYLFVGLFALQQLLRTYEIEEKWISLTMAAAVFGTNLFYYTLTEYSMSHLYSFTMITAFLLMARRYFKQNLPVSLFLSFIFLGITCLIRPVNCIILLTVPFIAGDYQILKQGIVSLKDHWYWFLGGMLISLIILSIQPLIYYLQTGSFLVYSYPGEGFNFKDPHISDVLFSYRKGLFIYTPLTLLSLAGLILLWKDNKYGFTMSAIFLLAFTYMVSSWHMWFYGGSFSQRVFIDILALFSILLAMSLQKLPKGWIRKCYISLVVVLILFCQFQTYQYRHMVIHWSDMTKERYWNNFFKLNP
ncbi:MAG: hypothetical protein HXX13_11960 [Bacteroidetes bacterium]|nr:hypothetical protein [Bacteroidota bacterium]